MPPTEQQLKNRQTAFENVKAGRPAGSGIPDVPQSPSQGGQGVGTTNLPSFRANVDANIDAGTVQGAADNQTTDLDLRSRIDDFLTQQQQLQQQSLAAAQPTEALTQARTRARELSQQIRDLEQQTLQGQQELRGQGRGITLGAISGQQGQIAREAAIQRQALSNELQAQQDLIEAEVQAQGVQQDAITRQMQFNQQNFQNLSTLQEMTTPNIISTQVDKQTGEIFALMRDPTTGEVAQQSIGAVTPEKAAQFNPSGTFTNNKGQVVAWGTNDAGELETHVVGQQQQEQDFLSVSEARKLGVPFGTTVEEARGMGITPVSSSEESVALSPEDKRTLSGAGFTPQDIQELERTIAEFGIDATLEELSERQARAVRQVYNIEEPVDIASAADRLLAQRFERRWLSTRGSEMQRAIRDLERQIEEFGVQGFSEEQEQQLLEEIRGRTVNRDEANRLLELKELLSNQ